MHTVLLNKHFGNIKHHFSLCVLYTTYFFLNRSPIKLLPPEITAHIWTLLVQFPAVNKPNIFPSHVGGLCCPLVKVCFRLQALPEPPSIKHLFDCTVTNYSRVITMCVQWVNVVCFVVLHPLCFSTYWLGKFREPKRLQVAVWMSKIWFKNLFLAEAVRTANM